MRHVLTCLLLLTLAGCSDPLANMARLGDVDLDARAGTAEVASVESADSAQATTARTQIADEDKPRSGLLGFLRRQADQAKAKPASDPVAEAVEAEVKLAAAPADAAPDDADLSGADQPSAAAAKPAAPRKGLFGALFGGDTKPDPAQNTRQAALPAPNVTDAADPAPDRADDPAPRKARKSAKGPKPGAPDYAQVGPGQTLPYGKIARLCGVSARKMGKRVETYPKLGNRYTLYDSAPGATGPRNFYLTGFDDGCARQFTAALVLFGTPETYEQIHYGAPSSTQPKAATDKAYERLKSRVCGVGRGKPCGAKIKRLSRDTTFVSIYERFGNNARWTTMLVHDGEVMALDTKS